MIAIVLVANPHGANAAATIVVNTSVDEDVLNATCSLREAIIAANTNVTYKGCTATGAGVGDMIVFDLETPTISIGSTSLPAITESVTIDGGDERVELHGPGAPKVAGRHGLIVNTNGFGTTIRNLVINNFSDDGIYIDAADVSVLGCYIGTDAGGTMAAPNQGFGVHVFRGSGARIGGATSGGSCSGDCNVISGAISFNANVFLDDNSTGAVVRGNFIGTDVSGTAAVPNNALEGVRDRGDGNRIGGTDGTTPGGACTGECNLISGNAVRGIRVDPPASDSIIQGNFIGTDVTGTIAVDNSLGIETYPATVTIGGTVPEARNIISGNNTGLEIRGIAPVVRGNYIGTNSAGTAGIAGTSTAIIAYQAVGAVIGGTMPGAGNVISFADLGVRVDSSTNTQIFGNLFGATADGKTPLPNDAAVFIHDQASNNIVGGVEVGAGNTIAFSAVNGVLLDGTTPQVRGNAIRGNSIYSSGAKGIFLRNNPNDNLPPPTILGTGPLHGTACVQCAVDIFSDAEDEGRVFEGTVFTNDGNWTFNGPLSGPNVTATNTDMSNNTSEFSAPFSLASPTPTASPTLPPTATTTRTRTASLTATAAPSQTPTRTATAVPTPASTATIPPASTATSTRTHTTSPTGTTAPSQTATRTTTAMPPPSSTATVPPTSAATATRTRTASPTGTRAPSQTATGLPTRTSTAIPTLHSTATATAPATAPSTPASSVTATRTSTVTPMRTRSETPSPTTSTTPTPSPTPTGPPGATPTATVPPPCVGDCDGGFTVSVSELITLVNIALGNAEPSACARGIPGGTVDVALIVQAVNNALHGCGASLSVEPTWDRPRASK